MSLFGKVLAFFNLLGVAGLVVMASMNYGKRLTWAYAVKRCEVYMQGLALDEEERDAQGRKVSDELSPTFLKNLFGSLGEPVNTQLKEVERVSGIIQQKLTADNPTKQLPVLARTLIPLTDAWVERQHLLGVWRHLQTDATARKLQTNYRSAWEFAVKQPEEMPLTAAFRRALVAVDPGAEPTESLTTAFLKALPADATARKAAFDPTWKKAIEAEHTRLTARLQAYKNAAVTGELPAGSGTREVYAKEMRDRRTPIARYLVRLAPVLAEYDIQDGKAGDQDKKRLGKLPPGSSKYEQELVQTEVYKKALDRAQVVIGFPMTLKALDQQERAYTRMAAEAKNAIQDGRMAFTATNTSQVALLRHRARVIEDDRALITYLQGLVTEQKALVTRQKAEVAKVQAALNVLKKTTNERHKDLTERSQKLYDLRTEFLEAQELNRKNLEAIRIREEMISQREKKKSSSTTRFVRP